MPTPPRRSRLITLFAIGIVAFIGIGSVAAATGMALAQTSGGPTEPAGSAADGPAADGPAADGPAGSVADGPAGSAADGSAPGASATASGLLPFETSPPERAATTPAPATPAPTATPRATAAPLASLTGYRWPLHKPRLTLPFGPTPWGSRIVDGVRFHDGIDLATVCGDRIVAAHDGIVLAAGRHFDGAMGWLGDLTPYYGRLDAKRLWSTLPIVVVIDDGNGYRSMYAHFSEIVVAKGQVLTAGSLLGYEGRTGRASGCHLHYGLFSPNESAAFAMDPAVVKRMKLPRAETARVDPLLVLPARAGMKPTPIRNAGPSPSPSPSPSPRPQPGKNLSLTP